MLNNIIAVRGDCGGLHKNKRRIHLFQEKHVFQHCPEILGMEKNK